MLRRRQLQSTSRSESKHHRLRLTGEHAPVSCALHLLCCVLLSLSVALGIQIGGIEARRLLQQRAARQLQRLVRCPDAMRPAIRDRRTRYRQVICRLGSRTLGKCRVRAELASHRNAPNVAEDHA